MSISTAFNRLKREIGVKRCVVIDGNVGDVYLDDKQNIVDLRSYLSSILAGMRYDNIYYWDRVDGLDGDTAMLKVTEEIPVEGDAYSLDDDAAPPSTPAKPSAGSGNFKKPDEIFPIIYRNLTSKNRRIAFIINWGEYLFSANGLSDEERQNLTRLSKALKDKKLDYFSPEINESAVIIIANKLSALPLSFYQGNPDVSAVTISHPDRLEREALIGKIASSFDVRLKSGETILTCEKHNEYIDMLDNFTSREIIQMARLSRKETQLNFDKLFYLFRYGEKENPWEKLDYQGLMQIKQKLAERVIGQDAAIEKIERVVIKAYMGLTGLHKASSRSMPKGVLFFVGPTGVGKTELSKALAQFLFGDDQACLRFDMSEYAQENSEQKLIGAPPGYVGYEEGGQLTNAVKSRPFSVILFDEIEKAAKPNPRILDIFLQILEDGRLTDSKGETVYFSDAVIIFTSNLGAAEVDSSLGDEEAATEFLKIVKNYFDREIQRPELMGRIGYNNIVPFNFIRDKTFMMNIARSKLKPIKQAVAEKYHLRLEFENEERFVEYILGDTDIAKGGRDILNKINDILLDDMALFLFKNREDLDSFRNAGLMVKTKGAGLEFEFAP